MRRTIFALFTLLLGATPLAAQTPALQPGARVRISAPETYNHAPVAGTGAWQVGEVTAVDTGWVTVRLQSQQERTFPFAAIERIEVSQGAMSHGEGSRRGVAIGAGVGAAVGAVFIGMMKAASGSDCGNGMGGCTPKHPFIEPTSANAVLSVAGGAALGAGLGAAFGATSHERWVAVPIPGSRVSVGATGRGGIVAMTLRL